MKQRRGNARQPAARRRLGFANLKEIVSARRRNSRPGRPCSPILARLAVSITLYSIVGLTDVEAQATAAPATSPAPKSAVDQLIPWLLDEQRELRGIAFSEVIFDTTGKRVLAIEPKNDTDARVIKEISAAMDETVRRLNMPDNAFQKAARINEVSSHVEDTLRQILNTNPGLRCDFPRTADGKIQRSGYPDLRVEDRATKRIFYLDPKLYAAGSRASSFRTFYFEPKVATNKVRDDAVHFIAGFEHDLRKDGRWQFTRWDLVDLSHFRIRLKAEFEGSNRDMYRPEAIVATSAKPAQ